MADSPPTSRHSHHAAVEAAKRNTDARFTCRQNWFELVRPDWERLLRVLEIDSFNGTSTT